MTSRDATPDRIAGRRGSGAGRRVPTGPNSNPEGPPMTNTPPPDIDAQVAEFRSQIANLAAVEPNRIAADVQQLASELLNAPDHTLASVAISEFHDAHSPEYAQAVIIGALSAFSVTVLVSETYENMNGPTGLLARMVRIAYVVRGLGITADSLRLFVGGEL